MTATIDLKTLKRAPPAGNTPAVFSIVRNESYFLPHFLAHYRALGVDLFVVYDDHSDDGTTDYLCAQPDCAVITSDGAFGDDYGLDRHGTPRRLPQVLKDTAVDRLLPGRWVVTADADEFLVLPEWAPALPDFIARLEATGQPYATAPMVDFYGETLNARNHPAELGPFAANPYFDVGPYYDWSGGTVMPQPRLAGLRIRLMFRLMQRAPEVFNALYQGDVRAPASWKAPLLKHGAGVERVGDHTLSIAPATGVTAALAHFKLYPGLDAKIAHALRARQYAHRSLEYAVLDACIRLMGDEPLVGPETRRFTGAPGLQAAGLLSVG